MKRISLTLLIAAASIAAYTQTAADKETVNNAVTSFLTSWKNHDFKDMGNYTTNDVYWISPLGALWNGKKDVQSSFTRMHQSFFKNTPLTEESRDVRFMAPTVALVNLLFKSGASYHPDGIDNGNNKVEGGRGYQTMVVVKQSGKWLIASAQVTSINESTVNSDSLNHKMK